MAEKAIPTIEFLFNEDWLNSRPRNPSNMYDDYYHLPPNDLLNLNQFILSDSLELVIVRISPEDLENEPFLPH